MTNRTPETSRQFYAKLAGFTFLFYIAVGITNEVLFHRAFSGEGAAAILSSVGAHATGVRVAMLMQLLECFSALVLAVAMYGITRDEHHELAMLGMAFRLGEGVISATGIPNTLGILWIATAGTGAGGPDAATANTLGALLLMPVPSEPIGAIFFAAGSTIFSYLLLRGRMVPVPLAWLGVLTSVLLLMWLPLQLVGFLEGRLTGVYQWVPVFVFQVALALWLLIKGVAPSALSQSA
jgi:hypothetical protein